MDDISSIAAETSVKCQNDTLIITPTIAVSKYYEMSCDVLVQDCSTPIDNPYPDPVVIQRYASGNPMCMEFRPQCTLEFHWRKNCW